MAGDIKALRSYLVALGFDVNQSQFRHFQNALKEAESLAKKSVGSIAGDVLKWQTAIVGGLVSVGAAVVGVMEHVSTADQEFRLFGQRMFMSTDNAKRLKIALDALGQPLEAIAFDPELHNRWMVLQKDQMLMQQQMGGTNFAENMRKIRDIRFEVTRFMVELQYFGMNLVNNLFKALGLDSGNFLKNLQRINEWIQVNIPRWSSELAQDLAPILKDVWAIVKDIGKFLGVAATEFSNLIGLVSGDSSIQGTTFSFHKFAGAVEHVTHWVAVLLDLMIKLQTFLLPFAGTIGGAATGAKIGSMFGPEGTIPGALIGGGAGAILDIARHVRGAGSGSGMASQGGNDYRALAARVGASLNVPADIIYSQWAHETGGFTNRGATSLNNLGGIRLPGSKEYRSFGSLGQFADYYTSLISRRYSGAMGARSVDDYASALKRGGYFEDSLGNYEHGMKSRISGYGGGSTSITVGDINITQPNASPEHIKNAVKDGILEYQQKQTSMQLSELRSIYG